VSVDLASLQLPSSVRRSAVLRDVGEDVHRLIEVLERAHWM
jgi:hypothetical protein